MLFLFPVSCEKGISGWLCGCSGVGSGSLTTVLPDPVQKSSSSQQGIDAFCGDGVYPGLPSIALT